MTIKASRALSHSKRLREPEEWTARMVEGMENLGEKLGVFLVQLPPNFACDLDRLRHFLHQVPPALKMSGAGLPCVLRATAPFVYVRLHGPDEHHLYAGSYPDDELRLWAERIGEWRSHDKDVWVYFNNDPHGHADTLKGFLGL